MVRGKEGQMMEGGPPWGGLYRRLAPTDQQGLVVGLGLGPTVEGGAGSDDSPCGGQTLM